MLGKTHRFIAVTVVAITMAGVTADAAAQQQNKDIVWVLSQAPADVALVVTVRSPQALKESLEALMGPELEPGALDEIVAQRDLPPGTVDTAGPTALVVCGREDMGPAEIHLLKDPSKLAGEMVGDGILKMQPPAPPAPPGAPEGFEMPGPPPVYCLEVGPYVVTSRNLEVLKAFQADEPRFKVTDEMAAKIREHLVWACVNIGRVKVLAATALEEMKAGMAEPVPSGEDPSLKMTRVFEWYLGLLDQLSGLEVVFDADGEGAAAAIDIAMVEGEPLLEIARACLPVDTHKGALPAMDAFLVAAWGRIDWPAAMPAVKGLVRPLMDILVEEGDEESQTKVDDLWAAFDDWATVLGPSFALAMEPPTPEEGLCCLTETFEVKDAAKYRDLMGEYMEVTKDFTQAFLGGLGKMPGGSGMQMDMTYEPTAEQIEGTDVDVTRFTMQPPEGAPPEAAAKMNQMMDAMYGPEGLVVRSCVIENRGLVTTGDAERMGRAIRSARGQGGDIADNPSVAAAIRRLPQGSVAALLVSLPTCIHTVANMLERSMLMMLPEPARAKLEGPDAPPFDEPVLGELVTAGVRLDTSTLRVNVGVPASEIRGAVRVGKAFGARMEWIMIPQQPMMLPEAEEEEPQPEGP
ncbi:MAG: hypothetical protein WBC53_04270 [Phycisphaerae bacterium]